jgi:predicted aspartyl protease
MELGRLLTAEGYLAVELVRSKSGLLEVPARVGGSPVTLFLDTGAIQTCFDQASAQRLELCTGPTEYRAFGLGVGDQPISCVNVKDFCIGPCSLPAVEAMMIDFSHVNKLREKRGDRPVDGVLGSDILAARAAVLDYGNLALYLRDAEAVAGTLDLAGFFASQGSLAVKLVRSQSGLLEAPARVGEFPATMVLDTGAGQTCLDRATVQRLALPTRLGDRRAVGLGVNDEAIAYVTMDQFWIGPCCVPAVEAVVTDFSHVQAARSKLGDQPFDGILGSDVLAARFAKLDYDSLTLYLQESKAATDGSAEPQRAPDRGGGK